MSEKPSEGRGRKKSAFSLVEGRFPAAHARMRDLRLPPATVARLTADSTPAQDVLELVHGLAAGQSGVRTTRENAVLVLERDPKFAGRTTHDDFRGVVDLDSRALSDATLAQLAHELSVAYGASFSSAVVQEAVVIVAMRHRIHPVRGYLEALPPWDGVERLATAPRTYFGVAADQDDEYHRQVLRRFLLQAIWRVMWPGCQADHMLVLEGPQGCGKSSAVKILGGEFAGAPNLDLESKDSALVIQGLWLVEWAEMDGLPKYELSRLKAWITQRVDRIRRPYGRMVEDLPRQCVFIATTNQDRYLVDETGGRRFWPLRVKTIALDELAEDREQLFAEAMAAYRAGEQPYFRWKLREQVSAQRERRVLDPWAEHILKGLQEHFVSEAAFTAAASRADAGVTMDHVASKILNIPKHQQSPQTHKRIAAVLRELGLERRQHQIDGKRGWWYEPPLAGPAADAIFGAEEEPDRGIPL